VLPPPVWLADAVALADAVPLAEPDWLAEPVPLALAEPLALADPLALAEPLALPAPVELAGDELLDAGGGVLLLDPPPLLLPQAAVTMAAAAAMAATAVHLLLRIRTPIELGRLDRAKGVRRAPQPGRGMAGRDGCAERSGLDLGRQAHVTDLLPARVAVHTRRGPGG
jgi:hypothetical protein